MPFVTADLIGMTAITVDHLPRSSGRDGLRRFAALASVAVVVSICAALARPLARLAAPAPPAAAVTAFGGPVSVNVDPRPIERVVKRHVRYSVHRIPCSAGAAPGTSCFTTMP